MEKPEPVQIANYSTAWPQMFSLEQQALISAFQPSQVVVEHIGSTSVVGLGAKPIVDILLGAPSLPLIDRHIDHIAALGYRYVPAFEATFPERRFFVKPATGAAIFHLHAVDKAAEFWEEHLAFRDALRSDTLLASRYLDLKRQLAARFQNDRERYSQGKAAFIRSILDARTRLA